MSNGYLAWALAEMGTFDEALAHEPDEARAQVLYLGGLGVHRRGEARAR